MNDDAQLIDQALRGDSGAFGQLVQRYQDRLFHTVIHVVGCREEAEDAVQDAFVQAFLKLETFQRQSAFYTWLYRIAINTAITRRRRKKVQLSVESYREQTGNEPIDDGDAPGDPLERNERADQVRQALAALSEEHRVILVLREMEGCCYETIADLLGLPVGTVRSRLHRARLQMREQLRQVLPELSSE